MKICLAATASLVCLPILTAVSAVTVERGTTSFGDKEFPTYLVENEYVRLEIVPDRGGRIVKWIDKLQGNANVVNLPQDTGEPSYGGLLDEHGWVGTAAAIPNFYNYTFEVKLIEQGPGRAVLELWPEDKDVFRRRMTLEAGSPLIRIDYWFNNNTQEDSGNTLVRNVVWPSGGPNPDDHLYSTPLTSGVRVDGHYVNTAQGAKREAVAAPWRAFGSQAEKRLVAFAYADDLFEGAYDWEGSRTRPTFEWYYRPVKAGKSTHTTAWCYIAHGFSKAAHVSERLVADLDLERREEGAVEIGWAVAAMDAELKDITIETMIRDVEGHQIERLDDVQLQGLELDKRREGKLFWASAAPRAVVIAQRVVSDGEEIASYEQPFELAGADYTREIKRPREAVTEDLEGWVVLPPLEIKPGKADRERGYVIYSNDGKTRGASIDQITIEMGVGEYESVELCFKALADLGGGIDFTVEAPGVRAEALAVSVAEKKFISTSWGLDRYGWRLSGMGTMELNETREAPDADKPRLWLIANSEGLRPGAYEMRVVITPERGAASQLPVRLEVLPVRMPDDRHYFLEANSHFNQLGQDTSNRGGWKRWEWNLAGTAAYANDFHAHGGRMLTAYAYNTAPGENYATVRLRDDGRYLDDALKEDASWLNGEEELPMLDNSFWDEWLQIWIDRGFTRYSSGYLSGGVGGYWKKHSGLAKRFKADDPQRVRRWLMRESARYLKEKGFRYVYGCIGDEIAADIFPDWIEAAKDAHECDWSPGVTIGANFFRNPKLYNEAGPLMDYWVMGDPDAELIDKARADGIIKPGNSVGSYDGWGTRFREYSHMRASMWLRAMNAMETFWVQCYIRNFGESIVFDEEGGPYSSASWEGVRDGVEDANYLKGALGMIEQLKKTDVAAAMGFRARLEKIVESIDKEDSTTMRAAKVRLMRLLPEIRKALPEIKPSLLWEELPIVNEGQACFELASGKSSRDAADTLASLIKSKAGAVVAHKDVETLGSLSADTIVFGHPDDTPWLARMAATDGGLGVTATYPSADSYIILERELDGHRAILIIGMGDGLKLGAKNFGQFLKFNYDYPGQYFADQ